MSRCGDNIKLDLTEEGYEDGKLIELPLDCVHL